MESVFVFWQIVCPKDLQRGPWMFIGGQGTKIRVQHMVSLCVSDLQEGSHGIRVSLPKYATDSDLKLEAGSQQINLYNIRLAISRITERWWS